jgi:uncharacterized protein (DUF697 family)
MNKKKLPNAIRRPTEEAHQKGSVAETHDLHELATPALQPKEAISHRAPEQDAVAPAKVSSVDQRRKKVDVQRRRLLALAVVKRHAAYSGVGGIIPIPVANIAGVAAVNVRMVKVLSELYRVPFERDRARAIVVGLLGGAMPTGLATATASTLVYVIPGANLVGLAVSSMTALACTRSIGRVFIEHFESGATLADFQPVATT